MRALIPTILDHLFPDPKIPLDHTNPFSFLIAVLLSAQCTDIKVNQVTPHLFASGNTPHDMLKLDFNQMCDILKPLGLYKTKAQNILNLSQILIDKHQAQVPCTFEELEALPGVGHKTASCVMSQIFKLPAFAVDTHIHRLAQRWRLSDGSSVEKTEKDLKEFFSQETWNKRHLQIIYYARSYCPARGHNINNCPICFSLSL